MSLISEYGNDGEKAGGCGIILEHCCGYLPGTPVWPCFSKPSLSRLNSHVRV